MITNTVENYQGTNVLGDVIVDVNPADNFAVQWVWNEFDYLDITRQPYLFPDWTHTNAVIYSPDDGNILVSSRHQNWLMKVDYANGKGSGNIIWHLGYQGDFTLIDGNSPGDWFYAQHLPGFTTSNTTGTFGLVFMDNGSDRRLADGGVCGTSGEAGCYTTIPSMTVDESSMTATLDFHLIVPTPQFSLWGGDAQQLANGNIEFDLCSQPNSVDSTISNIYEVTNSSTPVVVWSANVTNGNAYRGSRIPSLYPGVQW